MLTKVRRGNVILEVDDSVDNIQHYLNKGYSLIDQKTEEVVTEAIPNDATELRAMVMRQKQQIEELQTKLTEKTEKVEVPEEKLKGRKKQK